MVMLKTECERELSWFMRVAPTDRFFLPTCQDSSMEKTWTQPIRLFQGICVMQGSACADLQPVGWTPPLAPD